MLKICKHPLIEVKLSMMRDAKTKSKEFRENLDEIGSLMTYEVFRDLEVEELKEKMLLPTGVLLNKKRLAHKIVVVPILRAGLGMVDGVKNMIPSAKVGHIGLERDEETLKPREYYFKLPEVENPLVLIVDPMLATGGSAVAAISSVKKRGYTNIRLMCLVGVQVGVDAVQKAHPDVDIYLAALDEKLNEKGYIIPGLGDAGDRVFGTK